MQLLWMPLCKMSSIPPSLFLPSLQSKKLSQASELNWEDWCCFMLLSLSKRSSFSLLSHISGGGGGVKLHYCAGNVCLAEAFCLRAHEFCLRARPVMRPSVPLFCRSLAGTSLMSGDSSDSLSPWYRLAECSLFQDHAGFSKQCPPVDICPQSGTNNLWVAHLQMNYTLWSALPHL